MIQYYISLSLQRESKKKKGREGERDLFVATCGGGRVTWSFLRDEWIRNLFEPVDRTEERYCGSAKHGET